MAGNTNPNSIGNNNETRVGDFTSLTARAIAYINSIVSGDSFATKELEQNIQSSDYGLVLSDSGKDIFHPASDNNARTFTIPANITIPFPIGTCITFTNMAAANLSIAITDDDLILAGDGNNGTRTLEQYGIATAKKNSATEWIINGSGLS